MATALPAALLFAACLPRDDLASYSSSAAGVAGSIANPPTSEPTAGAAGEGPELGQGGGEPGPDPMLPLDNGQNGSGSADASSGESDAGTLVTLDAAPPVEPDAALDAGPAGQCARTQGTLEEGSDVCLFVAAAARVTWMAAQLACQSRNSTLVSIKTTERNDFLTTLIATDVWTGGNDMSGNPAANTFVWRDNSPVAPFGWAATEPDAVADQFCISKDALGPWRDRPCSELKAYVCEQQL